MTIKILGYLILLLGLTSCLDNSVTTVTLEIDIKQFIKEHTIENAADSTYIDVLNQVDLLRKDAAHNSGSYIDLFGSIWIETTKGTPEENTLSQIFKLSSLTGSISNNASDTEVIDALKATYEEKKEICLSFIEKRLNGFDIRGLTLNHQPESENIEAVITGLEKMEETRMSNILTARGSLGFWECWENDGELFEYFFIANEVISPLDTGTSGPFYGQESLLQPLIGINEYNQPIALGGPRIGYAKTIADRDSLNYYLSLQKVKDAFPPNIKFSWGASDEPLVTGSPQESGTNVWYLYALKPERRGSTKPSLDGSAIASAQEDISPEDGSFCIQLKMNSKGAQTWEELTTKLAPKFIDKNGGYIAVVVDNKVYSAPTVLGPITGGISVITGNFTKSEAQDLANILSAGEVILPMSVTEIKRSE